MTSHDHGPSIQEEAQQEPTVESYPPVSVVVEGPVRVQDLPAVVNSIRTVVCPSDNTSVNVANSDLRRKTITVISTDQPFILGTNKSDVDGSAGAKFPINVPIVITGTALLYAKSATNATAATLSVIELDWTE
jgi:hypothetical protein